MGNPMRSIKNSHQRKVAELFAEMERYHGRHRIWQDFITMSACTISVIVDDTTRESRRKNLEETISNYSDDEKQIFSQMFEQVVEGLEENPNQDFLGEMFMVLGLSNDFAGQYFTPFSISSFMAKLTLEDAKKQLEAKPWISVLDPACGAGSMLIAALQECKRLKINADQVLFVGQDIDRTAALMAFVQMSLLGVAGYICIGDSLSNPCTTLDEYGLLPYPKHEVWFTPGFYMGAWPLRCITAAFSQISTDQAVNGENDSLLERLQNIANSNDRIKAVVDLLASTAVQQVPLTQREKNSQGEKEIEAS